jgi:hypothetical protein
MCAMAAGWEVVGGGCDVVLVLYAYPVHNEAHRLCADCRGLGLCHQLRLEGLPS